MPSIPQSELRLPQSWGQFKELVADLFTRLWDDPHACRNAPPDQAQQGVDIYGQPQRLDGGYAAIRCKRYERGGLTCASVEAETARAEAFVPPLAEYLIATTDRRDATLEQALREINKKRTARGKFPVYVVFWEDLCRMLFHPDNRDILRKHYGTPSTGTEPVVPPACQIPEPPRTFVDREDPLHELAAALRGGATISTVRGVGGIGKSALAFKLAHRLAADYPDAQIFIDLRGTSPRPRAPVDVMGQLIHIVQPQAELPGAESEMRSLYLGVLRGRRVLLLLDDAADADHVQALVPPASCALLVTSRCRFRLSGMHALDLRVLNREAGRQVLCAIAPGIDGEGGADYAAEIAELCGYLPLALELAASALAERVDPDPADIARRLREERRRLDPVDASLGMSYDLLDEPLRGLWARLSVFSIPFKPAAAASVWEMALGPSFDALAQLQRASLIEWRERTGRYTLHARFRLFAYRKLQEIEDPRPVHRLAAAHLETKLDDAERGATPEEILEAADQWERAEAWPWFARAARVAAISLRGVGRSEAVGRRSERALAAVQEHLDEPTLEVMLLEDLGTLAAGRGDWDQAIAYFQRGLDVSERLGDDRVQAGMLTGLGLAYAARGESDQAIGIIERSMECCERLDHAPGMAQAFDNLGLVCAEKGEWDRAIECYQKGLEILERVGDVHGMAQTWRHLGDASAARHEWNRAIEMYQKSLQTSARVRDLRGLADTWDRLGTVYHQRQEWDRAIEVLQQSLKVKKRLGDIGGLAETWDRLGAAYRQRQEWDRAIEMHRHSLEARERLGDRSGMAATFNNLGLAYTAKREWDRAIECYQKDLEISERVGDVHGMAKTLHNLGVVYARQGELDRAIDVYLQSLHTKERLGDDHGMAKTWLNLGTVYIQKRDWDRAMEMYQRGLAAFERLRDAQGVAGALTNIGELYLRTDRAEEAKPLLRQAYLVLSHLGSPHADIAAQRLAEACGSADAASAYVAELIAQPVD